MANEIADVYSGSSFDDFLAEEGLREEVESAAIKRVLRSRHFHGPHGFWANGQ
jgi:uncharacterized protein with NAD-binding domain and iron-sulfur cluster